MAKNRALQDLFIEGGPLMLMVLCFVLLAILFVLPFIPAAREIRRKDDATPLFINMNYCKDPRYFAMSFRKLMLKSIGNLPPGLHAVTLSKQETLQISNNARNIAGTVTENILYSLNDLESENNVTFIKEVYARGNVFIGEANRLQALACDGDVHVRKGTRFLRWLDAEGYVKIEEDCQLGVSTTCGRELSIASRCNFTRLYGYPVVTANDAGHNGDDANSAVGDSAIFGVVPTERDISDMPPHSLKNCNIIAEGPLSIGEQSVIRGHIKSHGKVVTGASVTIMGNVFAEGDIVIGPGSRIMGTVFSQGSITVRHGVTIGTPDRVKSMVGKKGIFLEGGVRVYGYIVTEGKGRVA
jgi:cytoskeletal protein CcmA (bactofilin family)